MKIIIAGGRDFSDNNLLLNKVDNILANVIEDIEIVSGGADGADKIGEDYAILRAYKLTKFIPDYKQFDTQAPLLRNVEMAHYSTHLIAFWNGKSRGTRFMIEVAEILGLKVRVINY